jgi:hypothetical protein
MASAVTARDDHGAQRWHVRFDNEPGEVYEHWVRDDDHVPV